MPRPPSRFAAPALMLLAAAALVAADVGQYGYRAAQVAPSGPPMLEMGVTVREAAGRRRMSVGGRGAVGAGAGRGVPGTGLNETRAGALGSCRPARRLPPRLACGARLRTHLPPPPLPPSWPATLSMRATRSWTSWTMPWPSPATFSPSPTVRGGCFVCAVPRRWRGAARPVSSSPRDTPHTPKHRCSGPTRRALRHVWPRGRGGRPCTQARSGARAPRSAAATAAAARPPPGGRPVRAERAGGGVGAHQPIGQRGQLRPGEWGGEGEWSARAAVSRTAAVSAHLPLARPLPTLINSYFHHLTNFSCAAQSRAARWPTTCRPPASPLRVSR